MLASTPLEASSRDEELLQSWTYDFSAKRRPVQLGVHSGCAEYSTKGFAEHEVSRTRLSSWYGPLLSEILDVPTSVHFHFSRVFVAS
jgi:hypothetical protein